MTAPIPLVLAFVGLVVSAQTRLNAVIAGQSLSIPLLWLVAAALVLIIAALVLLLIRSGVRDGWLRLRPVMVSQP